MNADLRLRVGRRPGSEHRFEVSRGAGVQGVFSDVINKPPSAYGPSPSRHVQELQGFTLPGGA